MTHGLLGQWRRPPSQKLSEDWPAATQVEHPVRVRIGNVKRFIPCGALPRGWAAAGGRMCPDNTWTDDDYVKLCEAAKEHKGGPWKEEAPSERKKCPECNRPVATIFDEGIHNTGECGCEESRSLCWRGWNGNKCGPSPYEPAVRLA